MEINEINIKKILGCVLHIDQIKLVNLKSDEDLRNFGLDSITSIELVVKLEEEFTIYINDEDLLIDNVTTINGIEKLLIKYCQI